MHVLFLWHFVRACINGSAIALQSRRVKEENSEVSGGYLFKTFFAHSPLLPLPASTASCGSKCDPFGGKDFKILFLWSSRKEKARPDSV